jgi:hypothetical protein
MSEHTPGPWEWRDCGTSTVLWGAHGMRPIVLDCVRSGMQGAAFRLRIGAGDTMRKVLAEALNASPDGRLMKAAPDLLAACEAALAAIEYMSEYDIPITLRGDLEAAVKKARGK